MKQQKAGLKIVAVIDKTTSFGGLLDDSPDIDRVVRISAGKLRRYPNQSFLETLFDIKTILLNLRDMVRVGIGLFEALRLIKKEQPARIFVKGGFVAVPVGIAAHLKKIPFITHDSDAEPGLANRLIARWAERHLVGMPVQLYSYPPDKTEQVGIPVGKDFGPISNKKQQELKEQLGIPVTSQLVLVTGGSQGATALNQIISKVLDDVLARNPKLHIIHQTGNNQSNLQADTNRYTKVAFIPAMHVYTGAADVVVTRAGSFMAELAIQSKPAVVIPAPHLAGGHQVKNANGLSDASAAVVIEEVKAQDKPQLLIESITRLLTDKKYAIELGTNLHKQYPSNAAKKIAEAILKA